MRRSSAFTLIELLIAIGVIAALMGLALGVGQGVRAAAHSTGCKNNLRQFGHALSVYMDDYNEYIPRRGQGDRKLAQVSRMDDWFNALLPALGSPPYCQLVAEGRQPKEGDKHVLICPTASDPGWTYFLPYGMNLYLSPWIRPEPHRLSDLPSPATLVFLADAPGPYSGTMPTDREFSLVARHSGQANLVFLDSHVQAFEGTYLGCGVGDPKRSDVCWETGSAGVNWRLGN